jgi:immune inhibitor A
LQKRTAIWIAIIAILLVCVGLVYTAGLLFFVMDLNRDRQAAPLFTPSPTANFTANPTPTAMPAPVQRPTTANTPTPAPVTTQAPAPTPTPAPVIVQTPVLGKGPVPLAKPSTEELLAETVLPERDLLALTTRLKKPAEPIPVVVNATPPHYEVGDRAEFWISEQATNTYFRSWATLRYITPHVHVWVEDGYEVDQDALSRSAERFEKETYPTNRHFFGSEWTPGVDNDPHISIFNGNVPGVGGYYSSADEYSHLVNPYSNEREMFYINLDNARPGNDYYDGILAHEFQHMIHWHTDRNEDTWVNEGCSELASYLNEYDVGAADRIFSRRPDTQLTTWADDPNLAGPNYGGSYLFMVYFRERFGDEVLRQVVASKADGIAGFDEVLADRGLGVTFEDIFADWLIANYLDDPDLDDGRYGYRGLEIERPAIDTTYQQYPVQWEATVHQYGADYIELQAGETSEVLETSEVWTVHFTGSTEVELVDNEAHSGSYQWWSNRGDDSDTALTRAFDLTGLEQATLQAWLWYDIEEDYDYAYVEVSTDGGQTWDILRGKYTTDRNPTGNSFGHAYTGKSGLEAEASEDPDAKPQWVLEEMDLAPYAGQQILLRFEYVTDDAFNRPGFCVDDVSIPELGYHYDAEEGGGWEALGFIHTDNTLSQRYLVQIIELGAETRVQRIELDEAQRGQWVIEGFGDQVERAVLVVSALAPKTTELAAYQYSVEPIW